ncbi:MAG TPA: hypothetical protein VNR51_12320 [Hyphomicrobium sp.]|nr:hypothetical protein [Hyphomicrobium sp.]
MAGGRATRQTGKGTSAATRLRTLAGLLALLLSGSRIVAAALVLTPACASRLIALAISAVTPRLALVVAPAISATMLAVARFIAAIVLPGTVAAAFGAPVVAAASLIALAGAVACFGSATFLRTPCTVLIAAVTAAVARGTVRCTALARTLLVAAGLTASGKAFALPIRPATVASIASLAVGIAATGKRAALAPRVTHTAAAGAPIPLRLLTAKSGRDDEVCIASTVGSGDLLARYALDVTQIGVLLAGT